MEIEETSRVDAVLDNTGPTPAPAVVVPEQGHDSNGDPSLPLQPTAAASEAVEEEDYGPLKKRKRARDSSGGSVSPRKQEGDDAQLPDAASTEKERLEKPSDAVTNVTANLETAERSLPEPDISMDIAAADDGQQRQEQQKQDEQQDHDDEQREKGDDTNPQWSTAASTSSSPSKPSGGRSNFYVPSRELRELLDSTTATSTLLPRGYRAALEKEKSKEQEKGKEKEKASSSPRRKSTSNAHTPAGSVSKRKTTKTVAASDDKRALSQELPTPEEAAALLTASITSSAVSQASPTGATAGALPLPSAKGKRGSGQAASKGKGSSSRRKSSATPTAAGEDTPPGLSAAPAFVAAGGLDQTNTASPSAMDMALDGTIATAQNAPARPSQPIKSASDPVIPHANGKGSGASGASVSKAASSRKKSAKGHSASMSPSPATIPLEPSSSTLFKSPTPGTTPLIPASRPGGPLADTLFYHLMDKDGVDPVAERERFIAAAARAKVDVKVAKEPSPPGQASTSTAPSKAQSGSKTAASSNKAARAKKKQESGPASLQAQTPASVAMVPTPAPAPAPSPNSLPNGMTLQPIPYANASASREKNPEKEREREAARERARQKREAAAEAQAQAKAKARAAEKAAAAAAAEAVAAAAALASTSAGASAAAAPSALSTPTAATFPETQTPQADDEEQDDRLYCICQQVYDPERMMIACDRCDDWFHTDCVSIEEADIPLIDQFICPTCEQETGQHTTYKTRCARPECTNPAIKLSKYCSDWCGVSVAADRLELRQARPATSSKKSRSRKGGRAQDKARLDLDKLWMTVEGIGKAEAAIEILAEVAQAAAAETVAMRVTDVDQERELFILQESLDEQIIKRQALEQALTLANNRSAYLSHAISRWEKLCAEYSANNPQQATKQKRNRAGASGAQAMLADAPCGFDVRLVWDDIDFERWLATDEGRYIIQKIADAAAAAVVASSSSVTHGDATDPHASASAANGMNIDAGGPSARPSDVQNEAAASSGDRAQDAEEGLVCMLTRRKCDRHSGWQKTREADFEVEKSVLTRRLDSLAESERKLRRKIEDIQDLARWRASRQPADVEEAPVKPLLNGSGSHQDGTSMEVKMEIDVHEPDHPERATSNGEPIEERVADSAGVPPEASVASSAVQEGEEAVLATA